MDNIIDIEGKILEQLNTLKSPDSVFNEVDNVFSMENMTFPFVGFESTGEEIVEFGTCNDKIEGTFEIYMFQEINEKEGITRKDAKLTIQKGTKLIKELLQKNYTLDGNITNSKVTNIVYDTVIDEKGFIYYSKITYIVEFYKNIDII